MTESAAQPLFTVAIPTFNRRDLLKQTLDAVLRQTCGDFEVLIGDNGSTDGTEAYVRSLSDPRIRYHRHPQNIGLAGNFRFLTAEARGRFFVLNQDDDLLHRRFLERCRDAAAAHDDVTMYAAAWWRGEASVGYSATLPPNPAGDPQFIINDEPLMLDGREMAVHFFYLFHFIHPAIAVRTDIMRQVGGYPTGLNEAVIDLVMEVRVLCRGRLVYDPRPGAVYREHGQNYSMNMQKSSKRRGRRDLYAAMIDTFAGHGFDWRPVLQRNLSAMPDEQLMWVFKQWIRNRAPADLQEMAWNTLHQRFGGGWRFYRTMFSKVGVSKLSRYVRRTR